MLGNKLLRFKKNDRSISFSSLQVSVTKDCKCFWIHGKVKGTTWLLSFFFAYINIIQSKIEHHLSLQNIPNEWAKGILNDIPNLTEERMDEVMNEFLKDFKEGTLKINGWPLHFSAYTVSKAAVNAYTRSAAHKYGSPKFKINCVCPGSVQTDMTNGVGVSTAEQGAAAPVSLALLTDDAPSGQFFLCNDLSSFE